MDGLLVDTGVWLALLDAADPLHNRANDILESRRNLAWISTELVLSEAVTLVRRELGPDTAVEFWQDFMAGRIARLERSDARDWQEGLAILGKYRDLKLSMADCVSFATIRRLDLPRVASFDKHFAIVLKEREVLGVQ